MAKSNNPNGRPKGSFSPSKYTKEFIERESLALISYVKKSTLPLLEDFATKRGYHSQRVSEFANTNPVFSEALKVFKNYQLVKLVKKGYKVKNQAFAIFTMKNVAGWRDTQDVKHDFSDNFMDKFKDLTTDQVKTRINELLGSKTV